MSWCFAAAFMRNPEALDRSASASPAAPSWRPRCPWCCGASIACCGRGIGYIEPPLDKIHARIHFAQIMSPRWRPRTWQLNEDSRAEKGRTAACCFSKLMRSSDALNSSEWVFPIAECFHIAAFAWSIGMIALVDFRLLGVGMRRETSSGNLPERRRPGPARLGCGAALRSDTVPVRSAHVPLHNPVVPCSKCTRSRPRCIFNYTIHRKIALSDTASTRGSRGRSALFLWRCGSASYSAGCSLRSRRDSGGSDVILELFFQWLQSLSLMTYHPGVRPDLSGHHEHALDLHRRLRRDDRHHRSAVAGLVAFQNRPIADVVNGLRWWKRLGFVIMLTMGFLLFGSKAADYYPNPYFWTKMSILALDRHPRADLPAARL